METGSLETGPPYVNRVVGADEPPTSASALPVLAGLAAMTRRACGSENAPFTRWPVAVEDGSATLSVASPAVEMTLAVVLAVYVLATPGVKAPKAAGVPSDSDSVAGTVPPAPPGVLTDWTVTPLPPNSAQFRLNRLPPVAPPVTVLNVTKSSCLPGRTFASGTVIVDQVPVPPVDVRFAVAMTGPVIESWRRSTAASGEPAVRPAAASA